VLLEEGVDPNSVDLPFLRPSLTPLVAAASEGHETTVKLLLDHGAAIDFVSNSSTALIVAANRGHQNIVRLLLDNGANIDLSDNDIGETAVAAAAQRNEKVIFGYLIQRGANASIQDEFGRTAWHHARNFLNDDQIQEMQLQQMTEGDTTNLEI
jgi:ankyrin repeat protein